MEYITLSNDVKMPILGFGVYQIETTECERCVEDAFNVGYRLIDTAAAYMNEAAVGRAMMSINEHINILLRMNHNVRQRFPA